MYLGEFSSYIPSEPTRRAMRDGGRRTSLFGERGKVS
jgi:hypothetical protein